MSASQLLDWRDIHLRKALSPTHYARASSRYTKFIRVIIVTWPYFLGTGGAVPSSLRRNNRMEIQFGQSSLDYDQPAHFAELRWANSSPRSSKSPRRSWNTEQRLSRQSVFLATTWKRSVCTWYKLAYSLNPIGILSEQKAFANLRESNGGGIGDPHRPWSFENLHGFRAKVHEIPEIAIQKISF